MGEEGTVLNEALGPVAGSTHVADVAAAHVGEVQLYQSHRLDDVGLDAVDLVKLDVQGSEP
jgi:hypothetical protein